MVHSGLIEKLLTIIYVLLLTSCQTSQKRIEFLNRLTLENPDYINEKRKEGEQFKAEVPNGLIGYLLYDPSTGRTIESTQEDTPFIPASTAKVVTSVAALKILGPQFRFKTQLLYTGKIRNHVLVGDLYLKGGGDPTLFASHLMSLVKALSDHKIKEISGNFYYDESEIVPQSMIREVGDATAAHNPGVGAISLDFNQLTLQWNANPKKQGTLDVNIIPDVSFVDVALEKGSPKQTIGFEKNDSLEKWIISPALGFKGQRKLPVRHPSLFAALLFTRMCKMNGITLDSVNSGPKAGVTPKQAIILATHQSAPLVDIVERALEYSNNLMSELILLATVRKLNGRPESIDQAAHTLKEWFAHEIQTSSHDSFWKSLELVNGSGLSTGNRITPSQLVAVLKYVDQFRFEDRTYESLLPISAWKGSLANRLSPPEAAFRVWAKTGTMFYASSLSGYLYTLSGRRLIFAVMATSPKGRELVDSYKDDVPSRIVSQAEKWNGIARQTQDSLLQSWILKY